MRIILFALFLALAAARAPDTSLETTPVAYYGANWNRSQVNIDVLAKMQMVVLMQEDGHCWATCCPNRFKGQGQCGWAPGDPDATTYKGCDASCEEHGSQEDVFKRIAASAKAQGLPGPHNVLYMNSVYLWPFDAASALGAAAMVTLTLTLTLKTTLKITLKTTLKIPLTLTLTPTLTPTLALARILALVLTLTLTIGHRHPRQPARREL